MKKSIIAIFISIVIWCMFPAIQSNAVEVGYPKLILTHYSIDKNIIPGEETNLHLEFTNMSKSYNISEILVTYYSENNTIMPIVGSTNQIYITTMGKEETVSVDIPIVIYDIANGYAQASFQMSYTVANTVQESNSSFIIFPLESTVELSINNVNVTQNVETYAKSLISVSYANAGEEDIYNVVMNIKGDISNKAASAQIGNVKSGQNGYFEYYVSFEEAGEKSISVSFTYEDIDGKVYTLDDSTYSIVVTDSNKQTGMQVPIEDIVDIQTNNQDKFPTPIILVIAALGLVIVSCVIIFIAKKRK